MDLKAKELIWIDCSSCSYSENLVYAKYKVEFPMQAGEYYPFKPGFNFDEPIIINGQSCFRTKDQAKEACQIHLQEHVNRLHNELTALIEADAKP